MSGADGRAPVTGGTAGGTAAPPRRVPPVMACATAALVFVVAGGIDLAAHLPSRAPLGPVIACLAAAALALLAAVAAISRLRDFAWHSFRVVGGFTLLAYLIIAGMLEFVFVLDHTRGTELTILSLMLVIFAVDIPLLLAFTVARYQPASPGSGSRA